MGWNREGAGGARSRLGAGVVGCGVLVASLVASFAAANGALPVPADAVGGWAAFLAQSPIAAALVWIIRENNARDRERDASRLELEKLRLPIEEQRAATTTQLAAAVQKLAEASDRNTAATQALERTLGRWCSTGPRAA